MGCNGKSREIQNKKGDFMKMAWSQSLTKTRFLIRTTLAVAALLFCFQETYALTKIAKTAPKEESPFPTEEYFTETPLDKCEEKNRELTRQLEAAQKERDKLAARITDLEEELEQTKNVLGGQDALAQKLAAMTQERDNYKQLLLDYIARVKAATETIQDSTNQGRTIFDQTSIEVEENLKKIEQGQN